MYLMYYDDAEGNRVYTMLVRLSSTLYNTMHLRNAHSFSACAAEDSPRRFCNSVSPSSQVFAGRQVLAGKVDLQEEVRAASYAAEATGTLEAYSCQQCFRRVSTLHEVVLK